MRFVIIESPFAGPLPAHVEVHKKYLGRCLRDSLMRNEYPIASHGLFPQFFDDANPDERDMCMRAGHAWYALEVPCDDFGPTPVYCVVYADYGISPGMMQGIEAASQARCPIKFRHIGKNNEQHQTKTDQ